jgi:hypothetical protein
VPKLRLQTRLPGHSHSKSVMLGLASLQSCLIGILPPAEMN